MLLHQEILFALLGTANALSSLPLRQGNIEGGLDLPQLFSQATAEKILKVAEGSLNQLPNRLPDNVPGGGPDVGQYIFSDVSAWTSGFFPGSLYALLERNFKFPSRINNEITPVDFHDRLLDLSRQWSEPLHEEASRTDTHDMGFLIVPALRKDWELTGNKQSLESVITAAHSLASRYDSRVNAVRSWDALVNKRHNITDLESDFLIIIDSMCNLDLLYYAGHHMGNQTLIDIATTHAHTVLRDIVREDYSTFHCTNLSPENGSVIFQETVQGYKDWSTWSRGQAWSILGYAETYQWTKEPLFLQTARGLADYFVERLATATHSHPYVPLWDFDAPITDGDLPPRDTSAGLVAANGLLLLHHILQGDSPYFDDALRIVSQTVDLSIAPGDWDTILMNATINNNEYSTDGSSNTGLVYADYYFLQFGNRLLEMGFL